MTFFDVACLRPSASICINCFIVVSFAIHTRLDSPRLLSIIFKTVRTVQHSEKASLEEELCIVLVERQQAKYL
jgi:hypothetical protein